MGGTVGTYILSHWLGAGKKKSVHGQDQKYLLASASRVEIKLEALR